MALISSTPIWQQLQTHQQQLQTQHLRDLFKGDPQRAQQFSCEACGLFLDYSKNHLTAETLSLLQQLLEQQNLKGWIEKMYCGEAVNNTEQRAALHVALRNRSNTPIMVDGKDVMPDVNTVLAKMADFVHQVRSGEWKGHTGKPIEYIVNIGIGGSDLGPLMVTRALRRWQQDPALMPTSYFVSNIDSTHLSETLKQVEPETTLFVIASKTFTTQETMSNANSAKDWLLKHVSDPTAIAKHFVAVSTNTEKVHAFGIDTDNMFPFWDWVGGRFSVWSAVGLSVMLAIGAEAFFEFLEGAEEMDQHFKTADFAENLPVLLGVIGVWYASFWKAQTHAILPYDFTLEHFPAYLQQLVMESLGKCVTRSGEVVDYLTCPIVWGMAGNNGQHAFYQLLHQGTQQVPADFLVAAKIQMPSAIKRQIPAIGLKDAMLQKMRPKHTAATLSNALAQTHALMQGRDVDETRAALRDIPDEQVIHRVFVGNQPSNTLVYEEMNPRTLGSLIALYEHKVFIQSVCWDLNPFDQWGVELGKQVANTLLPALQDDEEIAETDASTRQLLNKVKSFR